jgi:hypothetical protein
MNIWIKIFFVNKLEKEMLNIWVAGGHGAFWKRNSGKLIFLFLAEKLDNGNDDKNCYVFHFEREMEFITEFQTEAGIQIIKGRK